MSPSQAAPDTTYVLPPPPVVSVPIAGSTQRFPVHRIYCVGRNFEEHAREMGFSGREPPFFFLKPADAVVSADAHGHATIPYPSRTRNLHHEVELVVAIGRGGRDIDPAQATPHIWGWAVGLDMTRRDLQNEMKQQGRPWCIAKAFDHSAPLGPLLPHEQAPDLSDAAITLHVNGQLRQSSRTSKLIWSVAEVIAHLSQAWTLQPGDLIWTGTPQGVGPVVAGDRLDAEVAGLPALHVSVLPA